MKIAANIATVKSILAVGCLCIPALLAIRPADPLPASKPTTPTQESPMQLGNFSVSLAVKDLAASRAFYEKLGFKMTNGDGTKWAVLQNQATTIGLFQGMFPKNTLTFNPGWDNTKATLPAFQDLRDLPRALIASIPGNLLIL